MRSIKDVLAGVYTSGFGKQRFRGDMIETYKILNNVYDKDVVPLLALNNNVKTRGNSLKLSVNRAYLNLKKFYFTSRIVNNWNSLPDTVI